MAAIARIPLQAAGGAAWDALAALVGEGSLRLPHGLRDVIVLLPFAALLAPARAAFARRGGWQPRIDTTQTLAASLGPAATAQPMQLGFDVAGDRLVAARLLREQSIGRAWLRRDPRRFDALVGALVDTAQALARAAHAREPAQREAYWADARDRLAPLQGPGAQQRWLARLALEWAAQAPAPATDRLFALRPAAWVVLEAGGADPLVDALLHAAPDELPCVVVDADAAVTGDAALPAAATLARCDDVEHEAQAVAAQVLSHLQRDEWPVALVGLDRQGVRRVRALLERQHVPLADETGWTLSTTRAAATVMALLRAALPHAGTDALFDALKSLPAWPGGVAREAALRELERSCRRRGLSRVEQLAGIAHEAAVADLIADIRSVLELLSGSRRSVSAWLEQLRAALQTCGAWDQLMSDEAGRVVLRVLRLEPSGAHSAAWHDAAGAASLGPDGFVAWVDAAFEAETFTPPAPPTDAVRVVITPLPRVMMRPFAALVCPGADDRHLGAAPTAHPLLSDAELVALGLAGRDERLRRERLAFAHALAVPRVTLLRRRVDATGEPLADSALLQRLELDLSRQGRALARWIDPGHALTLAATPIARPMPVAAGALPTRVSASAVEALRDCPYRFFARHVLGLREDDELEADLEKRDYGEWLHRVLRDFHAQRGDPRPADEEAAALQRIARQAQSAMGLADDEFLPFAASFARFVPVYIGWLHARDAAGARWQDGERELRIRPEALGGIELQGVIDRIDRVEMGGALELIDYKTSAVQRLKDKVRQPLEDTQLAFYAALLEHEARVPLRACYLPLDQGDEIQPLVHPQVQRSAEILVREVGAEFARLRAGAPLPALGEGEVCETCEARGLCRRDHWPDGENA